MPLVELLSAQSTPAHRYLHKPCHPVPVRRGQWGCRCWGGGNNSSIHSGHYLQMALVNVPFVPSPEGCDRISEHLSWRYQCSSTLPTAPGSWKQQHGEGQPSVMCLMMSFGLSVLLMFAIFCTEIASKYTLRPNLLPRDHKPFCLSHKPSESVFSTLIMFLCWHAQTWRSRLQKGKAPSVRGDLLAIRYFAKLLWYTRRRGEDFCSFRYWKSLLGILHIFCVALGKVLWPWFCTSKGNGSVAIDFSGIWITTLVPP